METTANGNAARILSVSPADWAYLVVRLVLAGIFVYAGAVKLLDVEAFARTIARYGLVPPMLLAPAAIGLPALEIIAGIALVFDLPGSLETVTALLLLFTAVLWFGILADLDLDCGCFSQSDLSAQESLREALYRDFLFLAGAGLLFLQRWRRRKNQAGGSTSRKN